MGPGETAGTIQAEEKPAGKPGRLSVVRRSGFEPTAAESAGRHRQAERSQTACVAPVRSGAASWPVPGGVGAEVGGVQQPLQVSGRPPQQDIGA